MATEDYGTVCHLYAPVGGVDRRGHLITAQGETGRESGNGSGGCRGGDEQGGDERDDELWRGMDGVES